MDCNTCPWGWVDQDEENDKVTSKTELSLWYLYDFGNSPFTGAGIAAFIPLLLAKYAAIETDEDCNVNFFGLRLTPTTISSTVISISVFVQIIVFLLVGTHGDYMRLKKKLLIFCTLVGGVATSAFFFVSDSQYYGLCAVLLIVSNVFFGLGVVYYNAHLPGIAENMPIVHNLKHNSTRTKMKLIDKTTSSISGNGQMTGYIGQLINFLIVVPIVLTADNTPTQNYTTLCPLYNTTINDSDPTPTYRLVILIVGLWWLVFGLISILPLRSRKGKPFPPGRNYLNVSVATLTDTFKKITKLPNLHLFFWAYFISSDTYGTINSVTVLFASDELGAGTFTITLLLILVPATGLLGIIVFGFIKRKFNIPIGTMISIHMVSFLSLCLYMLLGAIEEIPIGIKPGNDWELIICGCWFGFNLGSILVYLRSFYSQLLPTGFEAEFFSFYEISDKGSSWIGPLLAGIIRQYTGSLRWTFLLLAFLCVIPIPMFLGVDIEQAAKDNKRFIKSLQNVEAELENGI